MGFTVFAAWIERMDTIICLGMMYRYLDDAFMWFIVCAAWIEWMDVIYYMFRNDV